MIARIFGFASVAACLAMPVFAAVALSDAAGSYTISPAGSSIRFSVGKAGGGGLAGAFARFKGSIRIDNSNVGRSQVNI
ncbi:MAG: polyisoprenoid-binding protein, partial [Mesorhizobium sp.]